MIRRDFLCLPLCLILAGFSPGEQSFPARAQPAASRYAIIVGTGRGLLYPANDCFLLWWALTTTGHFQPENVFPLTSRPVHAADLASDEAPWASIDPVSLERSAKDFQMRVAALDRLAPKIRHGLSSSMKDRLLFVLDKVARKARPGDLVCVFVSGHGFEDQHETYLALDDERTGVPQLTRTLLPIKQITDRLAELNDCDTIAAFDVCRSRVAPNPIASRGMVPLRPEALPRGLRVAPPYVHRGSALLFASMPGQVSWESKTFRQGYFSRYLVLGLLGQARQSDNKVTLESLASYLSQEVERKAAQERKDQTPWFLFEGSDLNWARGLVLAWPVANARPGGPVMVPRPRITILKPSAGEEVEQKVEICFKADMLPGLRPVIVVRTPAHPRVDPNLFAWLPREEHQNNGEYCVPIRLGEPRDNESWFRVSVVLVSENTVVKEDKLMKMPPGPRVSIPVKLKVVQRR